MDDFIYKTNGTDFKNPQNNTKDILKINFSERGGEYESYIYNYISFWNKGGLR